MRRNRILGPVVLITIGILFTMDNVYHAWDFSRTWPIILVVIGVVKLVERFAYDAPPYGQPPYGQAPYGQAPHWGPPSPPPPAPPASSSTQSVPGALYPRETHDNMHDSNEGDPHVS